MLFPMKCEGKSHFSNRRHETRKCLARHFPVEVDAWSNDAFVGKMQTKCKSSPLAPNSRVPTCNRYDFRLTLYLNVPSSDVPLLTDRCL